MFRKDEPGNTAFSRDAKDLKVALGVPDTQLAAEPEAVGPQALRDVFYAAEPWYPNGSRLSPGMRRLQEKRVNRNLRIVVDWMLTIAERYPDEEKIHHAFVVEAEKVRLQIMWPELEAHAAVTALIQGAKELEERMSLPPIQGAGEGGASD